MKSMAENIGCHKVAKNDDIGFTLTNIYAIIFLF